MSLSQLALSVGHKSRSSEDPADIIEFVESAWGLNTVLYPVQRVILKATYGLALDDTAEFEVSDWRRQKVRRFTEKAYLEYLYADKRCNIKEVIPGKQRRELVLSIGRRSGKCILGNSLVLTDRGVFRIDALGDPHGEEIQPLDVMVAQGGDAQARSQFFYVGGKKPIRTLRTHCGYTLGGTYNHRIKVLDESGAICWKYLGDIRAGEFVCVHRGTDLWASEYVDVSQFWPKSKFKDRAFPTCIDEKWGCLLGYLVGDGTWATDRRVEITVGHSETWDFLKNLFTELFGEYHISMDKRCSNTGSIHIFSVDLRRFLHSLGFWYDLATDQKSVPWVILRSPRSVVCAFLRGLFEADGGVERGGKVVSFSTVSQHLASEVQILLLNLGIVSRVKLKTVRGKPYWILSVLGNTIKPSANDQMTYSRLERVVLQARCVAADQESIAHFEDILEKDYFFDPVVDVQDGEDFVYDLTVPDGHAFVANGMVNHNTYLSSCIAAYEIYRLILKGDPQKYFGLPRGDQIGVISVATDKDQAGILFNGVSSHIRNCKVFAPYTANNTQTYAKFQTPADIAHTCRYSDNPKEARTSIKASFRSCVAKGLRGAGNFIVILDELAHFKDGNLQSSAKAVYDAVTPSVSAFSPVDPPGPVEGRIISISSPLGRQGQFYELFRIAMKGGLAAEDMLAIQAPTWEVNPKIPASEFEKHFLKDSVVFFTEYGGEFTDRTRGWIEHEDDLIACVDPSLRPMSAAPARRPHFIGIDVGLVDDGSAVAIGHINSDKHIVLDYIDWIRAREGAYANVDRLEFDDVVEWVYDLSRRFYLAKGIFDRWAGIPFEQALHKKGLTQLESVHFTPNLLSDLYRNFKDMMWNKQIVLYDHPPPPEGSESKHCEYIAELLELQAEYKSKYITLVEAPNVDGKHDDRSDALVRMIWVASQHLTKPKYICGVRPTGVQGMQAERRSAMRSQRLARLQARRMGSSPDRQASKVFPGRIKGR